MQGGPVGFGFVGADAVDNVRPRTWLTSRRDRASTEVVGLDLWRFWAPLSLGVLMVVLILIPGEVWAQPVNDAVYRGFDPNLMYTTDPSTTQVSKGELRMRGSPSSEASTTLATTSLPKWFVSVDITVVDKPIRGIPFRVGVWNPSSGAGEFVVFDAAHGNAIFAEGFDSGGVGPTLLGGAVVRTDPLGVYKTGVSYRLTIDVDRRARAITTRISSDIGAASATRLGTQLPALFQTGALSLTASLLPEGGTASAILRNYALTLSHERFWAFRIADPRASIAILGFSLVGAFLLLIGLNARIPIERFSQTGAIGRGTATSSPTLWRRRPAIALLALLIAFYLVGNVALFGLGTHPYDMANERLYAYVARAYGADQVYYLPSVVPLAKLWNGIPYAEAAFPYEPVMAYLFAAIGWAQSLIFAGGETFAVSDNRLEYLIKATNVLFGLIDATLIYGILRELRESVRVKLTAAGLFLFNPAVWFSTSLWGQTHVISLSLMLVSVLLAEKRRPAWAWTALAAACLTRPQMLIFGLLLGAAYLRKWPWRQGIAALSKATIVVFIGLAPFLLRIAPSLPVDVMVNNLLLQENLNNGVVFNTTSEGAYSVWPLITYIVHGQSGLERIFSPSSELLAGHITYQGASQMLTLLAILALGGIAFVRTNTSSEPGSYLPVVALGIMSFLMLQTGLVATHFLLALPSILLCRKWLRGPAYLVVVVIWTVTTFVPMFGALASGLGRGDFPLMSPEQNAIPRFFVDLYSWDRFITAGVVANVCAIALLAYYVIRTNSRRFSTRIHSTG